MTSGTAFALAGLLRFRTVSEFRYMAGKQQGREVKAVAPQICGQRLNLQPTDKLRCYVIPPLSYHFDSDHYPEVG